MDVLGAVGLETGEDELRGGFVFVVVGQVFVELGGGFAGDDLFYVAGD